MPITNSYEKSGCIVTLDASQNSDSVYIRVENKEDSKRSDNTTYNLQYPGFNDYDYRDKINMQNIVNEMIDRIKDGGRGTCNTTYTNRILS